MKWTLKLVAEVVPGAPIEHEIATFERPDSSSPASIGLTIAEVKIILASLQKQIVAVQVQQQGASNSCDQNTAVSRVCSRDAEHQTRR